MITIADIIKEIKVFLKQDKIDDDNYRLVLGYLLDNYNLLTSDLEIIDFDIRAKEHRLSFKKKEEDYMYLVLTKQCIELRFLFHEQMIFFDEIEKFKKLNLLLECFFKGGYHISVHRNRNNKPVYKQIKWLNASLEIFNEEYKLKSFSKTQSIEEFNGINLTSPVKSPDLA